MVLNVFSITSDQNINDIDEEQRTGNYDRLSLRLIKHSYLTHFQPIHSSIDVDGIGTEDT